MQEIADSLRALDTKIENKSASALTILVGTSLLCIALKMVSDETRSNENVILLSNVSVNLFFLKKNIQNCSYKNTVANSSHKADKVEIFKFP